jgi:phosphoglycolate phosphatase-like HAD superfamily hydrolase
MSTEQQLIEKLRTGSFRGIIFDFDGTLLDIRGPLQKSIEEVCNEKQIDVDVDLTIQEIGSILESIQGYPFPRIILESYEIFKYITFLKGYTYLRKLRIAAKIFTKYLTDAKEAPLYDGVKVLLENLAKSSDLFIVSHNQTKNILPHLEREDIEKFFKDFYGTDKLPALKPSPEALSPPLEYYDNYKKSDFLMIGDMPTDVEAGKEAGFWTIGIASGISNKEILVDIKPDLLVGSISELLELIGINKNKISESETQKSLKIKP